MIRIMETKRPDSGGYSVVLFADSKAEIPSTGTATIPLITGWGDAGKVPMGSVIYTPQFDIAQMSSSDTWEWLI